MAALALGFTLIALAVLALQADDAPGTTADGPQPGGASSVDARALMHAEVACDFMSKAGQATQASEVGERTRYAVAVLLLDQAIIESGRAAQSDTGLVERDAALQTTHAAGHEGDHDGWQRALRTARAECRMVPGWPAQ